MKQASAKPPLSPLPNPGSPLFAAAATYNSGGLNALTTSAADLNGDGRLDLVTANLCTYANCNGGAVGVLLGNGDGTFQTALSYNSGGLYTYSVTVGDVNGDGKQDVLLANECSDSTCTNGSVGVLLGNGDGTFNSALTFNSGGQAPVSVALADMNGDGKADVLVVNECSVNSCATGLVSVLLGNGDGTFQAAVGYNSGGEDPLAVAVGDVNGDGKQDVVLANECSDGTCTNGSVGVLQGNGDGTFQTSVTYNSGGYLLASASMSDVNGDGKADLLVANSCSDSTCNTSGLAGVLLGNGDGTFQPVITFNSGGQFARSVLASDVNGDGKKDLLVDNQYLDPSNNTTGSVSVFLGNGDGTFHLTTSYLSGGQYANSMTLGDVNGDGKQDALVANECNSSTGCTSGDVGVLLGEADGGFQGAAGYVLTPFSAYSVTTGDVNGDGKADLVVASQCLDNSCTTGTASVLLGNGDGTFQTPVSYASGGLYPLSVALGDVNGDGKPDLLVGNECLNNPPCSSSSVGVLLGNGDGTFQTAVSYNSGAGTSFSVFVGDANGDGKADVVSAHACISNIDCSSGSVSVLLGNGDGTFQPAVTYMSGGLYANSVTLGDVNGDGKQDLVLPNECSDSNCSNGSVGVLLGNGDGTFQTAVTYNSGGRSAYTAALGDMNGDGKPDVVVMNTCDSPCTSTVAIIGVLLGNGDGTFQPAQTTSPLAQGASIQSIALADFDGDGKPDVASGQSNALWLGNGDGTLQTAVTLGATGPGITAGDFNGDGKPDVAVVNNKFITVLRNISKPSQTATSTALNSSANPSAFNQSVTFTATVTPSGSGTPTGTVTFYDGSSSIGTASLSNGVAQYSSSTLAVGSHSVTAVYGGDSNFSGSTSAAVNQVVNQDSTTTSLISNVNPSGFDQSVTFTATVSATYGGVVTGSVTFYDGTTSLGSAVLGANGQGALSTAALSVGTHVITAQYSGDTNNLGSTSSAVSQQVNAASTTTGLSSSANPAVVNTAVTFTATVTGQFGGTPSGTVNFMNGARLLGTAAVNGGVASLNITFTTAGARSITAIYSGDGSFAGSTSSALTEQITKAPSSVALTSSPNPSTRGQAVTFTATVSSSYVTIKNGDTVTFRDGTRTLGTATTRNGVATFTTSVLARGSHSITARFAGDSVTGPAVSAVLTQTVN